MRTIAGILHRHGQPVTPDLLSKFAQPLAHRGFSEKSLLMIDQMAGVVSTALSTNESLIEHYFISADVRLDNRDELLKLFALPSSTLDRILILAAYDRWNVDCTTHLLGDFAFAIWDKKEQRFFCVRDHMGVKPFFYLITPQRFAFASEIKALRTLPDVAPRLNEAMIGEFIVRFDRQQSDPAATFYEGIFQLPPRHYLIVDQENSICQPYWSWDAHKELRYGSPEAYYEAFRELFYEAVRCRLRGDEHTGEHPVVGSALSGGLDSSSITCVARDLLDQPLHTFHFYSSIPECDERAYVESVLAQGGLIHHELPNHAPLTELPEIMKYEDSPFYTVNYSMAIATYRAAKAAGVRILLDGVDGDTTIGHGWGYLTDLAYRAEWQTLSSEIELLVKHYGGIPQAYLNRCVLTPLAGWLKTGKITPMLRTIQYLHREYHMSRQNILKKWVIKPLLSRGKSLPDEGLKILAAELAVHTKHKIKHIPIQSHTTWRQIQHEWLSTDPLHAMLLEQDNAAVQYGIEVRHPLADKRIVEFCLALPPQYLLQRGWTRRIVRESLRGVLPDAIRERGSKINFSKHLVDGLLGENRPVIEQILQEQPGKSYIDYQGLTDLYKRFQHKQSYQDLAILLRVARLALWLQP